MRTPITLEPPSTAKYQREEKLSLVIPWSFRHTSHGMTGLYQLDGASDLTDKDDTLQDAMDGRGSTSNP